VELGSFRPLDGPGSVDGVDWDRITEVVVVCLVEDADTPDGVVLVLGERDGRWVVPREDRRTDEDVWDDAVLRIPLETLGFRRQGTHPFALDLGGTWVAFWVDGGRYDGDRLPSADVAWWTGPVGAGVELLREQGDTVLGSLVELAAESRRTMSYERRAADAHRTLVGAYLSSGTPQGGSGFGGSPQEWRDARGVLLDALPDRPAVTFLDHACANGHLAMSLVGWAAERGIELTPYGADIAPELVARAQSDNPGLADRFFVGDALSWVHPDGLRFDVVHVLLDVVPSLLHPQLIRHQLDHVVAPGGRGLLSEYGRPPAGRSAEAQVTRAGFTVAGRTAQPTRHGRPRGCPSVWVEAPGQERGGLRASSRRGGGWR
jgi:2-polyprenyl-3-methyl-5-hydroxy-6-metoxy-1,4-benzoquinol methylase